MPRDNRAWFAWGIAASFPAIVGRNPWVLAELLVIVLVVRAICGGGEGYAWLVRIVAVFVSIGVIFNLLTVHTGDRTFATIPDAVPIIGGDLTLNALVFGIASGLAIFVIVLVWSQVGHHLNWTDIMRQTPPRLAPIAAAGSVAWAWLPAMRRSVRDIREAQRSRGWQASRARDLPGLIVPVLAGGLERSIVTAEVLETRGFGGRVQHRQTGPRSLLRPGTILALVAGAYCFATGLLPAALTLLVLAVVALTIDARLPGSVTVTSRLRDTPWTRADTVTTAASLLSLALVLARYTTTREALWFEPYPVLEIPTADLFALTALLPLFAPAILAVLEQP